MGLLMNSLINLPLEEPIDIMNNSDDGEIHRISRAKDTRFGTYIREVHDV